MIIPVISKRGGSGCTTLSITISLKLAKHYNKKVCLVELRNTRDISKILNLSHSKCIDNLITELGFNDYLTIEDNVNKYDSIDIILGTKVSTESYLYKRSSRVRELLLELDRRYDIVIMDIRAGSLYVELEEFGIPMIPIHVLEHGMVSVLEYQNDFNEGSLKGFICINKFNENLFPPQDTYLQFINKPKSLFLYDSFKVKNALNNCIVKKGAFPLREVLSVPSFNHELTNLCDKIISSSKKINAVTDSNEIDEFFEALSTTKQKNKTTGKKKRFSLFSRKGAKR